MYFYPITSVYKILMIATNSSMEKFGTCCNLWDESRLRQDYHLPKPKYGVFKVQNF